jgi:hypothetical protein
MRLAESHIQNIKEGHQMAYNATYSTSDFSSMIVDLLGSGLFQVLQFIAIIVLIAIVGWLFAKVKRLGVKV